MSNYFLRVGIVKGWLLASNAPDTIMKMIDELAEDSQSLERKTIAVKEAAGPLLTQEEVKAILGHGNQYHDAVEHRPQRKSRGPMSPEHKQKLADGRERYFATKRAGDPVKNEEVPPEVGEYPAEQHIEEEEVQPEVGEDEPLFSGKPIDAAILPSRQDAPYQALIDNHAGYAGAREDGTLVPSDWGDICKMQHHGSLDHEIAIAYGVSLHTLRSFMLENEQRQEKPRGNVPAPRAGGAGTQSCPPLTKQRSTSF